MPLNISALAPGPAGTTMLGERGGIEAAAQRGLERQQREREEAAARESKVLNDATSDSGTTLTSENVEMDEGKRDNDPVNMKSDLEGEKIDQNASSHKENTHQVDDGSSQKHSEGKWERFKKHFQ
ncbi:uncharacterized protein BHQ10_003587 [Talaromyces amestolkiae]|uniref:Uncharacterized protein n=1 Tax=Talaromyces amestolkiae TaxID=1196081 RepID=A0A364KVJ0_TALAM|nr:uncharacterized protein BHQ10_003587 [Talaromyces amestolkiae]RAO67575.1 hypothetical protein BHQ10_003587 [Talaromyces amestolkiae]